MAEPVDTPVVGVSTRAPLIGGLAWIAVVAAAATAGWGELTLVDAMLLLAVLVVVPAAVPLHPAGTPRAAVLGAGAALPVGPALLADQGAVAGALAVPWVLAAAVGALTAVRWWWDAGRSVRDAIWPAAAVYLLVGAAWLAADRLHLEPAGFAAPFVQLTAIHFHYAGFASAVLVGCAWRWCPRSHAAAAAAAATVASPPIIALGFVYLGVLQIAGAVLLTLGLSLLAAVTVRRIVPHVDRTAGALLMASSLAVLVPMLLAVQWAVGANVGTPALSIPAMVVTHGVTNAVGFTLLGVVGWRVAQQTAPYARRHPAVVRRETGDQTDQDPRTT